MLWCAKYTDHDKSTLKIKKKIGLKLKDELSTQVPLNMESLMQYSLAYLPKRQVNRWLTVSLMLRLTTEL